MDTKPILARVYLCMVSTINYTECSRSCMLSCIKHKHSRLVSWLIINICCEKLLLALPSKTAQCIHHKLYIVIYAGTFSMFQYSMYGYTNYICIPRAPQYTTFASTNAIIVAQKCHWVIYWQGVTHHYTAYLCPRSTFDRKFAWPLANF